MDNIDKDKYKVYSDIGDYKTSNGGTIPATMAVTLHTPDIVIIDETSKQVSICELTVPFESNVNKQHLYKENKYAHFVSDINTHKATVIAFEVGASSQITPKGS